MGAAHQSLLKSADTTPQCHVASQAMVQDSCEQPPENAEEAEFIEALQRSFKSPPPALGARPLQVLWPRNCQPESPPLLPSIGITRLLTRQPPPFLPTPSRFQASGDGDEKAARKACEEAHLGSSGVHHPLQQVAFCAGEIIHDKFISACQYRAGLYISQLAPILDARALRGLAVTQSDRLGDTAVTLSPS